MWQLSTLHLGLLGALQGAALCAVLRTLRAGESWLAATPWAYGALLYGALWLPLLITLSADRRVPARRWLWALAVAAALVLLLGAQAGMIASDARVVGLALDRLAATGVLLFTLLAFLAGIGGRGQRVDYQAMVDAAWRNGQLLAAGLLIAGLFWTLIFTAAWLLKLIGVSLLYDWILKPMVSLPLGGAVFGLTVGVCLRRASSIAVIRRFCLAPIAWLLPLALILALIWLGALGTNGLGQLLATRNAAFLLLWFAALCIGFANAAYHQGNDEGSRSQPFPPRLAAALVWLWWALAPLVVIADWALAQRVIAHGWTPDRIWGAVVALLVTVYVFGYGLSIFRRSTWMSTLPTTNMTVAALACLSIAALITPLAEVNRLAVASQVARLESGRVEIARFDWGFLSAAGNAQGHRALERLAALEGGDERSRQIAVRAAEVLQAPGGCGRSRGQRCEASLAQTEIEDGWRAVSVLPAGAGTEPGFIAFIATAAMTVERRCPKDPGSCAIWSVDLNQDGRREMLLVATFAKVSWAALYEADPQGRWHRRGELNGGPSDIAGWADAVAAGTLGRLPPEWPDLEFEGRRLRWRPL